MLKTDNKYCPGPIPFCELYNIRDLLIRISRIPLSPLVFLVVVMVGPGEGGGGWWCGWERPKTENQARFRLVTLSFVLKDNAVWLSAFVRESQTEFLINQKFDSN